LPTKKGYLTDNQEIINDKIAACGDIFDAMPGSLQGPETHRQPGWKTILFLKPINEII
jgi:hypothetical protein